MNIFLERTDYLKDVSLESVLEADEAFFTVFKAIRKRLGDKQYWIDNYVKKTLEAINFRDASNNAESGFEDYGDLFNLCTEVMDGGGNEAHPAYQIVKKTMDKYSMEFQERETLRSIASVKSFSKLIKFTMQRFIEEESDEISCVLDKLKQQELFKNISTVVGEREMERLNYAIKQRFLIVPAVNAYLQGLNNFYLNTFLYRDKETERHIFQIILDEDTEV